MSELLSVITMPGAEPAVEVRPTRRRPQPRRMAATYDAAQTTDENTAHWNAADGLSANAAHSPAIRAIIRRRARYEIANNSYAKGMLLTLANDLIGRGPRLQMMTGNTALDSAIEFWWDSYTKKIGLAQKLRTARMAKGGDGESFLQKVTNLQLDHPVKLDLRLIETDQIATPFMRVGQELRTDGIVFDDFGNPMAYHLLKQHPGETFGMFTAGDSETIPAHQMIHWFRRDRPGQTRGVPEITPALPLFANLRRFTLAVIGAAEQAADLAGQIYTTAPADGDSVLAGEPFDAVTMERRTFLTMPEGWKAEAYKAEQPTTTYGDFKKEIINEIARCLNMPFNIAAGNSSGYNYASGRLDHQGYDIWISVERSDCENEVLEPIVDDFLTELDLVASQMPGMLPGRITDRYHTWFWPGRPHVDPSKEANADDTRLSNGTLSYPDYFAGRGQDWEEQQIKQAKALGLSVEEYRSRLVAKLLGPVAAAPPVVDDDEETKPGEDE